jgi:acetyl esterase/lipase
MGNNLENREAAARGVSPLTYVREDLPAILTIHSDADPVVPYTHGTRLEAALQNAGVANELMAIPKGLHGNFPRVFRETRPTSLVVRGVPWTAEPACHGLL